jgi:DnaJ-class molecular chaperone
MAARTDCGDDTGPGSPADTIRSPGDEAAPGTPQAGETTCPQCHGTGRAQSGDCPNCGGTGRVVQIVGDA